MVRNVLGGNLQGIDYVYTINGALKAINHPSLYPDKDRGLDGAGTGIEIADLFGEIIEYHPNDYKRTGSHIETNTNGLYDGLIYGIRYKTRDDVNGTSNGANFIDYMGSNQLQLIDPNNYDAEELANRYTYDHFGQLSTSTFGTFVNTTNSFTARNEYKEFAIEYDPNGNITKLTRNAYDAGNGIEILDDLTYTIEANKNKHTAVSDNANNNYPTSFNYKNQNTGTPATFIYNANGEMTSSPDELVDSVYYYPNGQQKRVVTNGGDYITLYEYDDQGNKFKTTYIDNVNSKSKYVYNIFGTRYEYTTDVGNFNLKEVTLGGAKRIGVYKQDVDGLDIGTGHAEYELTDHLGNVRVTFRDFKGDIQVLSRADYYAWGGQMPGRIWQQEDYRYGYQGQEKSQDQTTWDNFELRAYNHDLGRWSAPDPYAQFASPYLAMGNNPVTFVDPDGGYINMSNEGRSQRAMFMKAQMYDASLRIGRYSYDFLYSRYKDAMQDLYNQHFHGPNRTNSQVRLLEDLMKLNNDFAGLGLPTNVLSSGNDFATQTAIIENYDLVSGLIEFNGTADKAEQLKASFGKREGWAFMSRKEREEYMSSSELAPTYRLEAAFVHKKMVGKHKDSEDGKNDDIITGYTYFYVTEQGDKVTTTLHVDAGDKWYSKEDEAEAYMYMNILSTITKKEVGAFITADGIFIPDSRKNEFGKCHSLVKTKLNFVNSKAYLYTNGISHRVLGAIHTHPMLPSGVPDQGLSNADKWFGRYLNAPVFSMAWDGNLEGWNSNNTQYPIGRNTTLNLFNGSYSLINNLK